MVNPIKSIMKKILSILILQLFLIGLVSGQSAADIRQLKKQYESVLQKHGKINLESVSREDGEIDGDLPINQELELKQFESEKKRIAKKKLKHFPKDLKF